MRRIALALLAALAVAALLAGCGGSGSTGSASPSPSLALERATAILGHAPTGLARSVVERGVMVVGADPAEPPQSSVTGGGAFKGFDPDVARRVATLLGLQVRFKPWTPCTPPDRLGSDVDVLVASTAITPATQSVFSLTQPYYYSIIQTFVRRGGRQVANVSELFGRTVGVRDCSASERVLREYPRIRVRTYRTDAAAFADLRKGRLDFVVAPGTVGQLFTQEHPDLQFSGVPLRADALGFAVERGQTDWLALLDHVVAQLHRDGTLEALSRQWFSGVDMSVKE